MSSLTDLWHALVADPPRPVAGAPGLDSPLWPDDWDREQRFDVARAWLPSAAPMLMAEFPHLFPGSELALDTLFRLWLPWAIAQTRSPRSGPRIVGLLGGQGSGKTTFTRVVSRLLESQGICCLALSLDDLYLSWAERRRLQQQDPRLIWRGPPGTHDLALGQELLAQFRRGEAIAMPRFDKSLHQGQGDRLPPHPPRAAELLLFEGWFVGVRPLATEPESWPEPIVSEADRSFARDCQHRLRAYLPLWAHLDQLLVLQPEDYRWNRLWRQQAERELVARTGQGMDEAGIDAFVSYFWKALHPQLVLPPLRPQADLWVDLGADHRISSIHPRP